MARLPGGTPRSPIVSTVLLVVGLLTMVGPAPAQAVADGPPVIGQEPPVPQAHAPGGGGAVRIYGEGLGEVHTVTIGGVSLAATDFKIVDSDLIIAQVPAAGAGVLNAANDGSAHITVTDPQGTSTTDLDGDGVVDDQKCDSCVGGELGAIFYTDATLTLSASNNLDAGDSVTMTLDGHRPGTQGGWALTQLNPLVNFLEDAPVDPDTFPPGPGYGEVLDFLTPDANGDGSRAVTVKSTSSATPFNNKDQDFDANADCPVAQVTADYGLDKCILGYSEFGMSSLEKLVSFGADAPDVNPTPAAPTLDLTLSSAAPGSSVSVGGVNWNAAPHFGSDTATDDPGESAIAIDVCNAALTSCTPASSLSASVDPTRYFDSGSDPDLQPVTGVYSGATLSGSFMVPSCGANCAVVRIRQQRHDIEANSPMAGFPGTAGTYIEATASLTTSVPTNLAVKDVSVAEGNSGTTPAIFTVTRTGNVAGTSSVNYSTSDGTALAGSDYTAVGSTPLSFAAGEASKTVSVNVTGDAAHEPDQAFTLNLAGVVGATILDGSGTATIRNDDGPSYVSVNDVTLVEGNAGTTTAVFGVSREGNVAGTSSMNYATANGTATAGSDYTAVASTPLTFAAGETSKTVVVTVTGDDVDEANETFTVTLSGASAGTTLSDPSATATVANDDKAYLAVDNTSVTEGNTGTTTATFTVRRYGSTGGTSTVNYVTANGTATVANNDYVAVASTPLSFAAGEVSKSVAVTVNGDANVETNETFNLNLSSAAGATIADSSGAATIVNDDSAPVAVSPWIAVDDVRFVEGHAGAKTLNFTVRRSGNTAGTSSVTYATANGTATTTNGDYTAVPATVLNFAAGETTKSVPVTILSDRRQEADETVLLNLTSPSGATVADAQGTATLVNEDTVYFTVNDVFVHEGGAGTTTTADFLITRYGATEGATSVTYATANGTATAGSDYTSSSATLSYSGDETLKLVSVTVTGDTTVEPNETIRVNLTQPAGVTITRSDTQGTGTIVNDDP